jgi:hypothetical protein
MILAALSLSAILASNSPIIQTPARNVAPAGGGGGAVNLSNTFTGANNDPWSGFTEIDQNVNIQGNEGNFVEGSFDSVMAVASTSLSTIIQYQRYEVRTVVANSYAELMFRYSNSGAAFYTVEIEAANSAIKWYYWASLADYQAGTSTLIQSSTFPPASLSVGATCSFTITGTGASTRIRGWHNATGNTPTAIDNWGGDTTPDIDFQNDPASAADSGLNIGIGVYQNKANSTKIDNWFGGDVQ